MAAGDPPVKVSKLKAIAASGDTIKTPKGNIVTKQEWMKAKDNGLAFATHQDYANYVDRFAHPIAPDKPAAPPTKPSPPAMSDKAKGTSSNYYPAGQSNSPSPAAIKSTRY